MVVNLFVRNLDQSICFYRDTLGFCVDWQEGCEGVDQVQLSKEENLLLLSETAGRLTIGAELTIFVPCIETQFGELVGQAKLAQPLAAENGQIQFQIQDLDGTMITFAEVLESSCSGHDSTFEYSECCA